MQLPDTSHLSPEDAELLEALYVERNAVHRSELARVRRNALVYRERAETALPESA
jgi:hypothetical protein